MSMPMPKPDTINWPGQSGRWFEYEIFPISTKFKAVPGNYIYARETSPGQWTPVYIGETSDLSERFDHHHKTGCIQRNGATHIHVHASSTDARVRRAEEADLIGKWGPPCNG